MLLEIVCVSFGALGIIGCIIAFIIVKKSKKATTQKKAQKIIKATTNATNQIPVTKPSSTNFYIPSDKTEYKQFLSDYDKTNDLQFGNISYRLGARNTCIFGMSEGYRKINGKFVWDSVRIHTGVDRAGGGSIKTLSDAVICPFNFDRSEIVDYGDTSYGSLVILYNTEYGFCQRIAHMKPSLNIIPWSLEQFKKHAPFNQGWLIGSAGNYGDSDGAHTHTEILSLKDSCPVFEQLLYDKYGSESIKEYSSDEIISYYRTRAYFKKKSEKDILEDWANQKATKKITFMNKHLYRRILDNGTHITYYNSWTLFNM